MSFTPPSRIAIIGPGLLGGSLLMMLRARHPGADLRVWARREDAVKKISRHGLSASATTDMTTAVKDAGLVILCTPVETMPALARQIAQSPVADGCVVTDVGSVKARLVSELENAFSGAKCCFVGSHPMAGSHETGIDAARADLFDNAAAVITPTIFSSDHALETTRWLWRLAGSRIIEITPEEHDRKVARISHLPHMMSWILTLAALRDDPSAASCIGSGFRDSTRIAASDPGLWTGIISQNRAEVVAALKDARRVADGIISIIESSDDQNLRRFIEEAGNLHRRAVSA